MTDLFSAFKVKVIWTPFHAYLIESTAPNNIDDHVKDQSIPQNTEKVNGTEAIESIADALKNSDNPTLVISIHGFNNPRDVILKGYLDSLNAVNKDDAINNSDVTCIGYRWPSERMGAPFPTAFNAAPTLLRGLFFGGFALIAITWLLHHFANQHEAAIFSIGIFALATALSLLLLRMVVYFRDGYRATSFGVPDLVEIIRQIDKELEKKGVRQNQVQLSFIGHSMGAYVVTSAVRILSDVFDPASMRAGLNSTDAAPSPNIGHAFKLARLVLVSPDIPAEVLISTRANFLAASLRRFEEAFLFSNDGDEALRQISTVANYFSFPTKSNKFGYRLGNVCLPGMSYGISTSFNILYLHIGHETFGDIYNKLNKIGNKQLQDNLPKSFSYFDCTDCVENGKGVLTLARPGHAKRMRGYDHLFLLLLYIVLPRKFDVHGGYFRSKFLGVLIYRLACIGYNNTEQAYGGKAQLDNLCQQHQIRALLKS